VLSGFVSGFVAGFVSGFVSGFVAGFVPWRQAGLPGRRRAVTTSIAAREAVPPLPPNEH
jgi:hypothetical protein